MNPMTLSALAEPNRLRIVELLRDKPHSVGEISTRLALRQPQVSKHLRVLHQAGLVAMRPAAQQRIYQLEPQPFQEMDSWLNTFRRVWEQRLDVIGDIVAELKQAQSEVSTATDPLLKLKDNP